MDVIKSSFLTGRRGNEFTTYSRNSRTHDNYYGHWVYCAPNYAEEEMSIKKRITIIIVATILVTFEKDKLVNFLATSG